MFRGFGVWGLSASSVVLTVVQNVLRKRFFSGVLLSGKPKPKP